MHFQMPSAYLKNIMATKVKKTKTVVKKTTVKAKVAKTLSIKKAVKAKKLIKPAVSQKTVKADKAIDSPVPGAEKKDVIDTFATKAGDTGSPEVQIALLTKRIDKLVGHLKKNPADNHSRRGLLGIISKRRRLLNYLSKKDPKRAKDISDKLKLSK